MNCRRARNLIFDLIDNSVDESLKLELEHHIDACAECESLAGDLRRSLDLIHRAPTEPVDENFNWKVRLAIRRERSAIQERAASQGMALRSWNLRFAASAAAGFAMILAGGWFGVNAWLAGGTTGMRGSSEQPRVESPVARDGESSRSASLQTRPERPFATSPSAVLPGRGSAGRTVSGGRGGVDPGARSGGAIDRVADATPLDSLVRDALKQLPAENREEYLKRRIDLLNEYLERCRSGEHPGPDKTNGPSRP